MKVGEFIEDSKEYKEEAEKILIQLLGISRGDLFLRRMENIPVEIIERAENALHRAKEGEPLQYIFEQVEFYGRSFFVGEGVLIPRPETELLVESVLKLARDKAQILDLCTGSGIIGLTLKAERDNLAICMADISDSALLCAKRNMDNLKLDVNIIKSDLFDKIEGKYNIIVSNPPYIKKSVISKLDRRVRDYEPTIALDGGEDGLYFYRKIIEEGKNFLEDDGIIAFEIGYDQGQDVLDIGRSKGFKGELLKDYSNNDRIVLLRRINVT